LNLALAFLIFFFTILFINFLLSTPLKDIDYNLHATGRRLTNNIPQKHYCNKIYHHHRLGIYQQTIFIIIIEVITNMFFKILSFEQCEK